MDEYKYYVDVGGETCGPISLKQLAELYSQGVVDDDTIYATLGASEWLPISTLNFSPRLAPIIAQPIDETATAPSIYRCKTCSGHIAPSAEACVHCGQKWPTLNLPCPRCGANDFEIYEVDNSPRLWVPLTLTAMLGAAIFQSFQRGPQTVYACLNCGARLTPP